MKRNSIIELMELAISLADAELDGREVAHILLVIVQKAAQACEQLAKMQSYDTQCETAVRRL